MDITSIHVELVDVNYKDYYLYFNEKIAEADETKVVYCVAMGNCVLELICINKIADVSGSSEVDYDVNLDFMEHVELHYVIGEEIYEGSNRI